MEKPLINFCINQQGHSHEIVDALYAFYQSQDPMHQSWIDFKTSTAIDPAADLNIYLDYMPEDHLDLSAFDAVIYSNGCEPLSVNTQVIVEGLTKHNHFLACNSYLSRDTQVEAHVQNQVIWFPANILVLRDLWCRYFTSMFYQAHEMKPSVPRNQNLIFINGRVESWRHHLALKIQERCPDLPQKSSISQIVGGTLDPFFDTVEDRRFRDTVNDLYADQISRNQLRPNRSITCGIDGRFGNWPYSYEFISEFFSYRCVIFPESCWQNDEVAITEKILKCCYAGCFPWPVGGSNVNRLYNELGFYTAWNLSPQEMQAFDREKNHMLRYERLAQAIEWLSNNQEVMVEPRAQEMLQSNLVQFLTCKPEIQALEKFIKSSENY